MVKPEVVRHVGGGEGEIISVQDTSLFSQKT